MSSAHRTLRAVGFLTGLALAALLVFALRVPASDQPLGATVRMNAQPPGELLIRDFSFFSAQGLTAGGPAAHGKLRVRNITVGAVNARLRLEPETDELDHALNVELRARGHVLARGPLGQLGRWSRPVRIGFRKPLVVHVKTWVPASAEDWQGRSVRVSLTARAKLAEAPR